MARVAGHSLLWRRVAATLPMLIQCFQSSDHHGEDSRQFLICRSRMLLVFQIVSGRYLWNFSAEFEASTRELARFTLCFFTDPEEISTVHLEFDALA